MQTVEANKLIEKIQKEITKSGIKKDKVVEQLKDKSYSVNLRTY